MGFFHLPWRLLHAFSWLDCSFHQVFGIPSAQCLPVCTWRSPCGNHSFFSVPGLSSKWHFHIVFSAILFFCAPSVLEISGHSGFRNLPEIGTGKWLWILCLCSGNKTPQWLHIPNERLVKVLVAWKSCLFSKNGVVSDLELLLPLWHPGGKLMVSSQRSSAWHLCSFIARGSVCHLSSEDSSGQVTENGKWDTDKCDFLETGARLWPLALFGHHQPCSRTLLYSSPGSSVIACSPGPIWGHCCIALLMVCSCLVLFIMPFYRVLMSGSSTSLRTCLRVVFLVM